MIGSATFTNGKGTADGMTSGTTPVVATGAKAVYVDGNNELTSTASYDTTYSVNADTGAVKVVSGTGTGKFEAVAGADAYVSKDGKLTTETTSAGTATKDPLAAWMLLSAPSTNSVPPGCYPEPSGFRSHQPEQHHY